MGWVELMGVITSKQASTNPAWAKALGVEPKARKRPGGAKLPQGTPSAAAAFRAIRKSIAWADEMHKLPGTFIPVMVKNPLNGTTDRWGKVTRAKAARDRTTLGLQMARVTKELPVRVIMRRYGAGRMDAGCGLNAALKPVRDGVADYFGADDADPRFEWVYEQEKCPRGCYGVRVTIWGIHQTGGAKP